MSTVKFNDYAIQSYKQAQEIIGNVYKQDIQLADEMYNTLGNCFSRLINILMNQELEVDEWKNEKDELELIISGDFVKGSFSFWYMKNGKPAVLNGGIILHGFQETFSVELNANNKPHWSIHT